MGLLDTVKEMVEGWTAYAVSDPGTDQMATDRAKICGDCNHAEEGRVTAMLKDWKLQEVEGRYCKLCHCPLSAAVRSKSKSCPIQKW